MSLRAGELKQVNLLGLAERDTTLKRTGRGYWAGPCPFCGGRDRFVVKHSTGGWRWLCRHCTHGRYLDAADYLQRKDNVSFLEALWTLTGQLEPPQEARTVEGKQPIDNHEGEQKFLRLVAEACRRLDNPGDPVGAEVAHYLYRRWLLPPTWKRALLGARLAYDPKAARKRPAVAIPMVTTKLQVKAVKYRFADDDPQGLRYIAEKGSEAGWYYLPDSLGIGRKLLVLEGEINLLSVAQTLPCDLDLLSTGSETLTERMKDELARIAGRYTTVFCWFDRREKAEEVAQIVRGRAIISPVVDGAKWDANRLLQDDLLHGFIERVMNCKCLGWTLRGWQETQALKRWLELDLPQEERITDGAKSD